MAVERWIEGIRWGERSRGERRAAWGLAALIAVALLAAVDVGVRATLAHLLVATGEAEWIWDEGAPAGRDRIDVPADPAAFYARDDFALEEVPATAELQIRADEEYVAWVNGVLVGAAAYADVPRGSVDVYDVAPLLETGTNRIVVEVRSRRSVGGLLCRLHAGGETLSATGPDWRIDQRYTSDAPASADSNRDPQGRGDAPHVWATPPIGRWGYPRIERRKPISGTGSGSGSPEPVAATRWSRRDSGLWRPARALRQRPRMQGPWVTFDWGRTIEGHLALERIVAPGSTELEPVRALVLFGVEPPDARRQAATELPADEIALFVAESPGWLSARPARFRYATVLGLDGVTAAGVFEAEADDGHAPAGETRGALGVVPPALRTPVENEVRRQLEDVLGVAAR